MLFCFFFFPVKLRIINDDLKTTYELLFRYINLGLSFSDSCFSRKIGWELKPVAKIIFFISGKGIFAIRKPQKCALGTLPLYFILNILFYISLPPTPPPKHNNNKKKFSILAVERTHYSLQDNYARIRASGQILILLIPV